MNSLCLGKTVHARLSPKKHSFSYSLLFFVVQLSDLKLLGESCHGFSYNGFSMTSLRDKDFFTVGEEPIFQKVSTFLENYYQICDIGNIILVTSPRIFGYVFNPVSFYFVYDSSGKWISFIAEVTNTYKEMHLYTLIDPESSSSKDFHTYKVDKDFHVSPFFIETGYYQFDVQDVRDGVNIKIHYFKNQDKVFYVDMIGDRFYPLRKFTLFRFILHYLLVSIFTMPRILFQAFILYFIKGLKAYMKPTPISKRTIRYDAT